MCRWQRGTTATYVRPHQKTGPSDREGVMSHMSHLKRKRVLAGLGVVVSLALAGAAIAYFTSTGSGNGTGSVGIASNWTVVIAAPSGGPLYPGAGSQTFAYTVTNASSGHQKLQATASSVVA